MRLLFLTSRLPYPPDRGDRLRAFHFLRALSQDHEIDLLSFVASEQEKRHIDPLLAFCRRVQVIPMSAQRSILAVGLNFWRRQPLQVLYYRSAAMQQLVDRALVETRFDAVYVHLFRMAPYMARCEGLYRIVDLTDVISQELSCSMPYRGLVSRLLYAVERPRIARYERWVAAHFEETWLISEYDRAVLAADCPQANIRVVRNGVDVAGLVPTGEAELPDSLILVGHMGVFHNIDAARYLVHEILPRVRAQIPGASVSLVGAAPTPEVQSLAAIPGVQVTGFVADLNRALNQASVFVAPLRFAAGVQNKVLEALAAGRPVVATPLVNQGLGASAERDLLVGEQADEIAAQITRLLRDPALRRQLGQAGRRFVEENYSWERVRERMKQIQEGCL